MNKKLLIIIVLVALLAGGGGAAAVFLLGGEPEPAEGEAVAEVVAKDPDPIFLDLQPPFTVNFRDKGTLRYLQTEIQLMHTDQQVIDDITLRMPMIRNNLIMILSEQTFAELRTREAKEELRVEIAASINELAGGDEGLEPPVEVYITKFIMQ